MNIEPTSQLELVAAEHRATRAEHQRIAGTHREAKLELERLKSEHQGINSNLRQSEASAALGGSANFQKIRKDFITSRDAADFATARVAGLEASLHRAAADASEAKRHFENTFNTWADTVVQAFIREYTDAVNELLAVMVRGSALAIALGTHTADRMFYRMAFVKLPVLGTEGPHQSSRFHAVPDIKTGWRDDPEAAGLYQDLTGLRRRLLSGDSHSS